jgi:hypothetical protein
MRTSKIVLIIALLGLAMSGGIHRVAQSRWNTPQAGQATQLSIFFSMDCDLPAAGYLRVGIPSGSSYTPSTTGVVAWPLTTSFTVPTTGTIAGTCAWANNVLACTFASALTKSTAYGLTMSGSGAVVGAHAPVTMETRMNNLATAGPVMDRNRVFDSINVAAAAGTITLAATKITATGATAKEFPGETALMEFVVTMADWAATKVIKAPWKLVLSMANNAARNRAQVATSATWVKYPVTYSDWTWGTTCTNTQWGVDDADTSDKIPAKTLKVPKPTCAVTTRTASYDMVIPIAEDLTTTDYSTFKIRFRMDVTMPKNLIGKTTPVTAYIMDNNNYQMHAKSAAVQILQVTKPSGQANTQATGLVSGGFDPNDATQITQGVGVYSTPYCIKEGAASNGYGDDYESNCGITSTFAQNVAATETQVLDIPNAIEINWALPYEIPNDRTWADIICKTEQLANADTDGKKFTYDPLRIHQSSMIAKGWGTGNCFYLGCLLTAPGQHRFQCRDMGKLAKSANLQLAFQFSISNSGKGYLNGNANEATKQIVTTTAKTLACELKINTWKATKDSTTNWYQATFTTNIDGNTQTSKSGQWQSFIGVRTGLPSLGQKGVLGDHD